jgi:hypothetical protein
VVARKTDKMLLEEFVEGLKEHRVKLCRGSASAEVVQRFEEWVARLPKDYMEKLPGMLVTEFGARAAKEVTERIMMTEEALEVREETHDAEAQAAIREAEKRADWNE